MSEVGSNTANFTPYHPKPHIHDIPLNPPQHCFLGKDRQVSLDLFSQTTDTPLGISYPPGICIAKQNSQHHVVGGVQEKCQPGDDPGDDEDR
jgi:hypothetical protein